MTRPPQVQEGHLIADSRQDFLEQLKTIVAEQADQVRQQQEDVEDDQLDGDGSTPPKVEEPAQLAEPETEVTQSEQNRTEENRRGRRGSANIDAAGTSRLSDEIFELGSSPRDCSRLTLRDCIVPIVSLCVWSVPGLCI